MKLHIKDVDKIEIDLISNTVKCLAVTGFILWQTRKSTRDEAMQVFTIINRKRDAYLRGHNG